jgi:hypothetical protein
VSDDGDVDRRLAELEEVLDREAAAARRAVEAPPVGQDTEDAVATREEAPPPAPTSFGMTILKLAGLGVAAVVGLKIVVPLLLLPVIGAIGLAVTVLKLAFLGAAVYGVWTFLGKKREPDLLEK